MASTTDNFALTRLEPGDGLESSDGQKFLGSDRDRIDAALYIGTTTHKHRGNAIGPTPAAALSLASSQAGGGSLPGGNNVYYRYAFLTSDGIVGPGSAEAFVTLTAPGNEPVAPTLSLLSPTGGSLVAGDYYYILTYYQTVNTKETLGLNASKITVASGSTNRITVDWPSTGIGMTGVNVYRRKPGQAHFYYLTSIADPTTIFSDTGAVAEDCERGLPANNTTNQNWNITVTRPGSVPSDAVSWNIYRSFDNTNWGTSLVANLPVATTSYNDIGNNATAGSPPEIISVPYPEKITLTSGQEVKGTLAPANNEFLSRIDVSFGGTLTATTGKFVWYCDYDEIYIEGVRAVLGRGSVPVAASVIVDAKVATDPTTPVYSTIFNPLSRPTIPVGQRASNFAVPVTTRLLRGHMLVVDILQAGGGATPGDRDMVVSFKIWVRDARTASTLW